DHWQDVIAVLAAEQVMVADLLVEQRLDLDQGVVYLIDDGRHIALLGQAGGNAVLLAVGDIGDRGRDIIILARSLAGDGDDRDVCLRRTLQRWLIGIDLVGQIAGDFVEATLIAIGDVTEDNAVDGRLIDVTDIADIAAERDLVYLGRRRLGIRRREGLLHLGRDLLQGREDIVIRLHICLGGIDRVDIALALADLAPQIGQRGGGRSVEREIARLLAGIELLRQAGKRVPDGLDAADIREIGGIAAISVDGHGSVSPLTVQLAAAYRTSSG